MRVFPIRGQGGSGIPLVYKISRNNKYRLPLVLLGVDSGKATAIQRIKIQKPGPKYFHFPLQEERGYDSGTQGLISERQVIRRSKAGCRFLGNIDLTRNEHLTFVFITFCV